LDVGADDQTEVRAYFRSISPREVRAGRVILEVVSIYGSDVGGEVGFNNDIVSNSSCNCSCATAGDVTGEGDGFVAGEVGGV